ncbi:hypothetical protein [Ramlibacter sp.]|jgi:hypothetical protein|uniref:hypothetical protein n=1 Tax=Ramlibacter sp. TaxID=1917967 RepID=UPI002D76A28B|nr:hypothetical protein [Ramlibacter sp.]
MDPAIANQNLDPPLLPVLRRGIVPALLAHVLLVGALSWGVQWKRGEDPPLAEAGSPARNGPAPRLPPARPSTAAAPPAPAERPVAATAALARTACPAQPLLASAGGRDGQLAMPPARPAARGGLDEIDTTLWAGKEAAAAGRMRDAEVAYLTSCQLADSLRGPGSVEAANARYQLGRHYAFVAGGGAPVAPGQRPELLRRAEAFYADSLQSYTALLGADHERTRFAADGLGAVRETLAQAGTSAMGGAAGNAAPPPRETAQPAPRSPGVSAAAPAASAGGRTAPGKPTATAGVASSPGGAAGSSSRVGVTKPVPTVGAGEASGSPQVAQGDATAGGGAGGGTAERVAPSFDCTRARSTSEKLICSDAQLARLDRELGRLHARAKAAASDPAAFKRAGDAEWLRRERECRDRECLLAWYAKRREQLEGRMAQARGDAQGSATR